MHIVQKLFGIFCRYEGANAIVSPTYLFQGMNFTVICQTLIDLEILTTSSTEQVTTLFIWRGVGYFIGCVFLGHFYDVINHDLYLGACTLAAGGLQIGFSWTKSLLILSILVGIQGICIGLIAVGTYVMWFFVLFYTS